MQGLTFQEEFNLLQEKKFLLPNDKISDIKYDLYEHNIWAEIFWRRRNIHAQREDPELSFVFQHNPSTLLEIGAAYGRVLRKLMEWEGANTGSMMFKGIEICKYFKPYFQRYQLEYPSLRKAELIYDNFLTTSGLKETSFDIILLPMNTLPSFSYNSLETLFTCVKKYLSKDGMFLLSNYKIPNQTRLRELMSRSQGYSGELDLELGSGFIASEHYDLPAIQTDYGAYIVTYVCFNTFSRNYVLEKRELIRYTLEFILKQKLQKIIEACGFSIEIFDDSSHSFVYGLVKT